MSKEPGTPFLRDLGNELGEFSSNGEGTGAFRWLLIVAGGVLLAGLVFAGTALLSHAEAPPPSNRANVFFFMALFAFIALVMLGSGISAAVRGRREGAWRLRVFEDGVRFTLKETTQDIRWDEVESLGYRPLFTFGFGGGSDDYSGSMAIPVATYGASTITTKDGHAYSFSGTDTGAAQQLMQRTFGRTLLERMQGDYSRGEEIILGLLSISRTGIEGVGKRIPWSEVEYVRIAGAYVEVKQRGKLFKRKVTRLQDVENAFILSEALQRLAGVSVRT